MPYKMHPHANASVQQQLKHEDFRVRDSMFKWLQSALKLCHSLTGGGWLVGFSFLSPRFSPPQRIERDGNLMHLMGCFRWMRCGLWVGKRGHFITFPPHQQLNHPHPHPRRLVSVVWFELEDCRGSYPLSTTCSLTVCQLDLCSAINFIT